MPNLPPIEYSVRRSRRSRRIRIAVHGDARVIVSAPERVKDEVIARVVESHRQWIEKAVEKILKISAGTKLEKDVIDKREFTQQVKTLLERQASLLGVRVAKTSVRRMKSRWGSCSRDGNISINLLLGHLPGELLEYVAVHELCHLVHHNHSKAFWSLVASHLPDYKSCKKLLHRYGYLLRK